MRAAAVLSVALATRYFTAPVSPNGQGGSAQRLVVNQASLPSVQPALRPRGPNWAPASLSLLFGCAAGAALSVPLWTFAPCRSSSRLSSAKRGGVAFMRNTIPDSLNRDSRNAPEIMAEHAGGVRRHILASPQVRQKLLRLEALSAQDGKVSPLREFAGVGAALAISVASALSPVIPSASAATVTPTASVQKQVQKQDLTENAIYKMAFEQVDTMLFAEVDWTDNEATVLSQELPKAKGLKKLFLNGNKIQCDGANALAASIKKGGAPNLKVINLAGNRGVTEADRRALREARKGLEVSLVKLKRASDGDVYKRVDDGKLRKRDEVVAAQKGLLVDGSGATCTELKSILALDRDALDDEKLRLKRMGAKDPAQIKTVEGIEALEKQVERLDTLLVAKTT